MIRDFIYLDIERVRSFLAQTSEGLTSERTIETGHEAGAELTAEGKVPFLARGEGTADYRFLRTLHETKSLHDYIFAELLNQLEDGRLLYLPQDDFAWEPEGFRDGSFVLASGIVKIVDYEAGLETLKNIPKLMRAISRLASFGAKQQEQTQDIKSIEAQLRSLPLTDLGSFIDQLYGGLVRVKVYPYRDPSYVFVGTAEKVLFRYATVALSSLYGSIIDADWQCLLQINRGVPHAADEFAGTGNQVEDSVEVLIDQIGTLTNLTQSIQFPNIAVTPIAIYREIGA